MLVLEFVVHGLGEVRARLTAGAASALLLLLLGENGLLTFPEKLF